MKWVVGALLMALLGAGSAAANTPKDDPEYVDETRVCSGYKIHLFFQQFDLCHDCRSMITIRDESGRIIHRSFPKGRPEILECGTDFLGQHQPVLVIQSWSGGAHCCFQDDFFQLGPEFRHLLSLDNGNFDGIQMKDVDGDGIKELVTADDTFAYFEASFAGSAFPLRIYCLKNKSFTDCTREYPAELENERDRDMKKYMADPGSYNIGFLIEIFIDDIELGREEEFWEWAKKNLKRAPYREMLGLKAEAFEMWRTRENRLPPVNH